MASTLPVATGCCSTCDDQVTVAVPGPAGADGAAGAAGADGIDAYSITSGDFDIPAEGADVNVVTDNGLIWATPGQIVYVQSGGYFMVVSVGTPASLRNIEDTALGLYTENNPPGFTVPLGSQISPAGIQGPSGAAATTPAPTDATYVTITANATLSAEVTLDGKGTGLLHFNDTTNLLTSSAVNLASADVTGTLPIGNGGTGQTTANPAFNALAPTTLRGDMIYRNATVNARLAVGAANTVVRSNGTDPVYGKVVLTTDVSGVLPVANGGTGTMAVDVITTAGPHTLTTSYKFLQLLSAAAPTLTLPAAATAGEGFQLFFHNHTGYGSATIQRAGADQIMDASGVPQTSLTVAASEYAGLVSDGGTLWYITFFN